MIPAFGGCGSMDAVVNNFNVQQRDKPSGRQGPQTSFARPLPIPFTGEIGIGTDPSNRYIF